MTGMTMLMVGDSSSSNDSSSSRIWLAGASCISFLVTCWVQVALQQQLTANVAELMDARKALELKACTPNQDNSAWHEPDESQVWVTG